MVDLRPRLATDNQSWRCTSWGAKSPCQLRQAGQTPVTPDVPSFLPQVDQAEYSVGELASLLGVTRQAVQARVKSGAIRATKVDGVWRIPAAVANALLSAEHTKAVVSGRVTVLPVVSPSDVDRLDELTGLVLRLEGRAAQAESERAAQADRLERLMTRLTEQAQTKQEEIDALQEDRRRLRRAITALVNDDGP